MSRIVTNPPARPVSLDGVRLGGWWHDADAHGRIVCDLCPRACHLKPGDRGFCFVRQNQGGQMVLTTYGRSTGFCVDPIEKKPLNHFFPGTSVLSFGTAGCNLGCKFCQNWSISKSRATERLSEQATPETIAEAAHQLGCRSVAFTYNDPVIWAEYAIDAARACRERNIKTVAVTAGYITPAARGPFFAAMDAANVDLKGFSETFYQRLTLSHLEPVLDTLAWLQRETDVWIEITNLVIPGENDSGAELRGLCDWLLDHVGAEVPLHFTAFHPDFRLRDREPTPPETLIEARAIARQAGLKYVYVGNVYDEQHQSTYCGSCGKLLIERDWYELGEYHLEGNCCGHCGARVSGHFDDRPGTWGRKRLPVKIGRFVREPPESDSAKGGDPTMSPTPSNSVQPPAGPGPVALSQAQEQAIHRAACEIVAAAITESAVAPADSSLAGAAGATVMGCFVTIKRKGKLRACCGFLGRPASLAAALAEAATTTATRDARLPSISVTELPHLDLSVSLLHGFRPITSRGTDRVAEVQVGTHGLQITFRTHRGLLLPVVATENGWDAERFLEQVCRKAGLPEDTWKEPDADLVTFQARVFGGPFAADVAAGRTQPARFTAADVRRLAAVCAENIVALVAGATPTFYLPDCPDGTVQGVTIAVRLDGVKEKPRFAQLSVRPGIPMQATLLELSRLAAGMLREAGYDADHLNNLTVDVAILWDPAMHGTVKEPDLAGLDVRTRAVLVMERGQSAWVFDPDKSPSELVAMAAGELGVRTPAAASVTSLAVASTAVPMVVAAVSQAKKGPRIRPAAVAGKFYPGDPGELDRAIDELLSDPLPSKSRWPAAMVPHAGLKYSGRVAAAVFERIELPETIIVLAPRHTRAGVDWAVAPHQRWSIPGAELASDPDLAAALCRSISGLELDAAAHAGEHAIEVQLPLLARLAPQSRVVGITIGTGDLGQCQKFARGLAGVLRTRPESILLVISSDMNHFASDVDTHRLDQMALESLESLDPAKLFHTVRANRISMCGVLPAVIVMQTLRELGRLKRCERVDYTTSGAVTGETDRVVGYAGVLLG